MFLEQTPLNILYYSRQKTDFQCVNLYSVVKTLHCKKKKGTRTLVKMELVSLQKITDFGEIVIEIPVVAAMQ